jgi:hypothetical protein
MSETESRTGPIECLDKSRQRSTGVKKETKINRERERNKEMYNEEGEDEWSRVSIL